MAEILKSLNCYNCSFKQRIFLSLTKEELEILNKHRFEVKYNRGEIVFKQGAPLTHIACLVSGYAKVYLEGKQKNLIIKLIKEKDIIGGPGMFTDFRHHFSVAAITDSVFCYIEVEAFKQVVNSNNRFAIDLLTNTNEQGIRNFQKFINLTQKNMPGRVADAIFYLADVIFENDEFEVWMSRQELGELTDMTKESFVRICKELKDEKIVAIEGNKFRILNREALLNISLNG